MPAAWRAELDSDALRARAQAFKDEAGQEAELSYPGGVTAKAWRTDFTDATSPRACRAHGPVALWRVGAVESFRETFDECPFFEGAGLERWRVGRGKNFTCMFWGCESLKPRLGGWRLRHNAKPLRGLTQLRQLVCLVLIVRVVEDAIGVVVGRVTLCTGRE